MISTDQRVYLWGWCLARGTTELDYKYHSCVIRVATSRGLWNRLR